MISLSYLSKSITAILIAIPSIFMVIFNDVSINNFVPVLFIIALATPTILEFFKSQNKIKALIVYSLFTIMAIAIELIGIKTGFPYGNFHYSDRLPLKVAGEVPVTLSITFVPLLIGAFAFSQYLSKNKIIRILLTTLLLVLADLVLDPGAVYTKMWFYESPGFYYDVPLSNYFGWIFTGLIFSTVCVLLLNNTKFNLIKITFTYKATVWYWTIACLLAGLYIPAIIGIILLIYLLRIS